MADQLVKEGRKKKQPPSHLSYREVKTYPKYKENHLPQQDWSIQPKPGRVPSAATTPTDHIFRLKTGNCRLYCHSKRIGIKSSAQCPCGEAAQTPEHYLQSCSLYHLARQQIWPTVCPSKPSSARHVVRGD